MSDTAPAAASDATPPGPLDATAAADLAAADPTSLLATIRVYHELMKPGVIRLLQITAMGAILSHDLIEHGLVDLFTTAQLGTTLTTMLLVFIGGYLSAGGASVINMWYDRDIDRLMERTAERPIPRGHVDPTRALIFGIAMAIAGPALLWLTTNWVAAFWSAFSVVFYVFIYTMILKRRTAQNIVIGGLAGGTPPLVGWAATLGDLGFGFSELWLGSPVPWMFFLLIFLWTPPHTWALVLFRTGDYMKANVPMLPDLKGGPSTIRQMVAYNVLLIGLAIPPLVWPEHGVGPSFSVIAAGLGIWFLVRVLQIDVEQPPDEKGRIPSALRAFLVSIYYLMGMFAGLVISAALPW